MQLQEYRGSGSVVLASSSHADALALCRDSTVSTNDRMAILADTLSMCLQETDTLKAEFLVRESQLKGKVKALETQVDILNKEKDQFQLKFSQQERKIDDLEEHIVENEETEIKKIIRAKNKANTLKVCVVASLLCPLLLPINIFVGVHALATGGESPAYDLKRKLYYRFNPDVKLKEVFDYAKVHNKTKYYPEKYYEKYAAEYIISHPDTSFEKLDDYIWTQYVSDQAPSGGEDYVDPPGLPDFDPSYN